MPSSRARRSSLPRLALRVGLLAGALLDAASTLASLDASYRSVALPALGLRAVLQGLACYDPHRYSQAIAWIAWSLAATAAAAAWGAPTAPLWAPWAALYGGLAVVQLAAWRVARP